MTRFKFLGFLLPLAIAGGLALGLMSVPAGAHLCANHNRPDHPHCTDDPSPDNGDLAHLTLGGAMSVTNLVVSVKQNSPKRIWFGDNPFLADAGHGIIMNVDTSNCGVDPDFPGSNAPTNQELLDELSGADIEAGMLVIIIDKKKLTTEFLIEYFVVGGALEGRIRIYFREDLDRTDFFPFVTGSFDFPDTDLNLTIRGSIAIWWEDAPDLNGSKIMVCDVQDVEDVQVGQVVTVVLESP